MRHLVLLSGGPDSALALKDVLTNTDDPVVVLHVSMIPGTANPHHPSRWEYELSAVRRLVDQLKTIRAFEIHYAKHIQENFVCLSDLLILAPYAAGLCNYYKDIEKIWTGDDLEQDDGAIDTAFKTIVMTAIFSKRNPTTNLNIEYCPIPGTNRSKQQIREQLGETLWYLSWSCRNPSIDARECGECESCLERKIVVKYPTKRKCSI